MLVSNDGDQGSAHSAHSSVVIVYYHGPPASLLIQPGLRLLWALAASGASHRSFSASARASPGACLLHVAAQFEHHRHGSLRPHDATDAEGIANSLAWTVSLRDHDVDHRGRAVAAYLEHGEDVVGAVERPAPVRGGLDPRVGTGLLGDAVSHQLSVAQPLGVDIYQRDGGLVELGEEEQVTQQRARDHRALGPDERELHD